MTFNKILANATSLLVMCIYFLNKITIEEYAMLTLTLFFTQYVSKSDNVHFYFIKSPSGEDQSFE